MTALGEAASGVDGAEGDGDGIVDGGDPPARARLLGSRLGALWVTLLAAAGLLASFTLAVDRYRLLADPSFRPACDLNPVLSCGSVMTTEQAAVLGFPNPLIGVIAFAMLTAVGALALLGATLPRAVTGLVALGSLAGAGFVHWLAFQSLYRIGALCPWCMVVWVVTLAMAVWSVPAALADVRGAVGRWGLRLWGLRGLLLLTWLLIVGVAVLERFWTYWRTLL